MEKKQNRTKKTIKAALIVSVLFILAFPVTALAAPVDLNTADIAAINTFISAYPDTANLLGWSPGDPDGSIDPDWTGVSWYHGRITSIDISGKGLTGALSMPVLSALTILNCSDNSLSSLDVSACSALKVLYCQENNLQSLDVSACNSLESLYCHKNCLSSLKLPQNLTLLSSYINQLESLDVSALTMLTFLDLGSNKLKSLDVSACIALEKLYCSDNKLTSTSLSTLPSSLTHLSLNENQLESLDVSALTMLTYLDLGDNLFTILNVSACTALEELHCPGNRLTSLDVSMLENLTELFCYNNNLTSLNVSGLKNLTDLSCFGNQLTKLDLTGLSSLTVYLYCSDNPLRTFCAPNGYTLTIVPTSGAVTGDANDAAPYPWDSDNFGYNLSEGEITLSAVPGTGRSFERWILPEDTVFTNNTNETSNPVSFKLNGDMTAAPVFRYYLISAPADYTGDEKNRVLSADGDIAYYSGTTVDGNKAPASAGSGSTVVTLPGSYLHSLAEGKHYIRILFTDGYAETVLIVSRANGEDDSSSEPPDPTDPADKSPQTGDTSRLLLWIYIMGISLSGILPFVSEYKKRTAKTR